MKYLLILIVLGLIVEKSYYLIRNIVESSLDKTGKIFGTIMAALVGLFVLVSAFYIMY